MAMRSAFKEKNPAPASSKQFSAALDPSNPLGMLERVFEFVARETDFFKSGFLLVDVVAAVKRVKDRVEAEDKERKQSKFEENGQATAAAAPQPSVKAAQENNGPRETAANHTSVPWSHDEEKRVAEAWSIMSKEARYAPKNQKFWERTAAHFNENRPKYFDRDRPNRTWSEIREHYYRVMRDVNQFSEWYEKFYYEQKHGDSKDDPLEAAFAYWDHVHSCESFKYIHVWRVMVQMKGSNKLFPLKIDCPAIKKKKIKKPEPEGAIEKQGEEVKEEGTKPEDDSQRDRQAKKKAKTSESGSTESKVHESRPVGQPEGMIWKRGEEVAEEGLKQKEMKLKELELMQKEYDIVMRDTSGMTSAQREFHFKFVNQIRARHTR